MSRHGFGANRGHGHGPGVLSSQLRQGVVPFHIRLEPDKQQLALERPHKSAELWQPPGLGLLRELAGRQHVRAGRQHVAERPTPKPRRGTSPTKPVDHFKIIFLKKKDRKTLANYQREAGHVVFANGTKRMSPERNPSVLFLYADAGREWRGVSNGGQWSTLALGFFFLAPQLIWRFITMLLFFFLRDKWPKSQGQLGNKQLQCEIIHQDRSNVQKDANLRAIPRSIFFPSCYLPRPFSNTCIYNN